MSIDALPDLWREERDRFTTPNLYKIHADGSLEWVSKNFRQSKMDREYVLFFAFEGQVYFPVFFEFRSINNNLLFLIEELGVRKFSDLKKLLISSLEKEERIESDIRGVLIHLKQKPRHCWPISNFDFDVDCEILHED